jgi:penicillin-binding protein 2
MLAAALQEGVVSENTGVLSVGGIRIGQWFFPDWKAGGHGRVDAKRAIAESVNTYFYYIGGGYEDFRGLGVEKINYYGDLFGLGKQTGIDLAGESSGFLPTPAWKENVRGERWYIGDTYHLSIGQGDLLVTPLQVAMFTSVFANGGKLYRPHFIRKILSSDDRVINETAIEPVREDFIDAYNVNVVKQAMRQTVVSGSARKLANSTVEIAGKTGTAQWSTKKANHAWFTGFAPYDEPKIVITILIEEGKEGSEVAVPIAGEFINWYFSRK